jgi:hypothetical protein
VTNLKNGARLGGGVSNCARFHNTWGQWLFNKAMNALGKQGLRRGTMMNGWRRYDHAIHAMSNQLINGCETLSTKCLRHFIAARLFAINNSYKVNPLKLGAQTNVVATHATRANNAISKCFLAHN